MVVILIGTPISGHTSEGLACFESRMHGGFSTKYSVWCTELAATVATGVACIWCMFAGLPTSTPLSHSHGASTGHADATGMEYKAWRC